MTDHIKVRTVLDGIVKVPKSTTLQTITDLKKGIYNLRGWEASTQHLYQNGTELKDDQTLSDSLLSKGFVLLIPINHQQRRYKSKIEIESEAQQSTASSGSNLLPTTPTSSGSTGSVSDQLAQIMHEFTSTHPSGNTTTTTATRPPTQPVQNTTQQPRTTAPPTTTQPPRPTQPSISDIQRQLLIDNFPVDDGLVGMVMELGFSKRIAKKALILHNLDPEAAVEWIFSNVDNPYILESEFSVEELMQLAQKYQNAMRDE